jgi:Fe-S oxidoreductase
MSASLEKGLNSFAKVIDAPIASFFSSCVSCGMCADACLFYQETGDPKYTPIAKLEPLKLVWQQEYTLFGRLKKALGFTKKISNEELKEYTELVYNSCTMCARCSMVCPVGNDIAYMIRKMREGMAAGGFAPAGLVGASTRAVEIGSPMGLTLKALQAQIKHCENATGLKIELDKKNVEYMVLLSSMELINFPEYMEAIAKIFASVGKSWTISSTAFEATNSGIQIGSSDIARELVQRIVTSAEDLQVKTVISPECGHAFTAIRYEGPNLIGRSYDFEVKHILEVLNDFNQQGLLITEGLEEDKVTFHDPCSLVRKGGVVEEPRNLLQKISDNFVEMEDHGVRNWCCGGGGGASAIEEGEQLRLKAFKQKQKQIEKTEADTLVTACANCRIVLEEGMEFYNIDMPIVGLTELLSKHLVDAKNKMGEKK